MSTFQTLLNRTRAWFQYHTRAFSRSDFWPGSEFKQAGIVASAWALPSLAGVILIYWLGNHHSVSYFQIAISEGIGPHIWNVFAVLGVLLGGLLIAGPRQKWLAIAAYQVLQNAYALGALMLGLLLGESICLATSQPNFLLIMMAALLFALCLNLAVWYVAFLVSPARLNTGFMHSVKQLAPQFRLPLAVTIVLIALDSFYVYLDR